ncbi:serine hydrolase-like protein [Cricetulus griseus]|uniref:serine hydrolase-like protein n=1 Tax=Cricetulus griseus TaxID=10029 RepID=UPI000454653A|nr:serine hydrolase-like protein [Cricetulus griseus]
MDFGGHGLSSHYSPGLPYYHHNFVSEVRRVAAAFKWTRFSLLGHSFGGTVGGMVSSWLFWGHLGPFWGCWWRDQWEVGKEEPFTQWMQ